MFQHILALATPTAVAALLAGGATTDETCIHQHHGIGSGGAQVVHVHDQDCSGVQVVAPRVAGKVSVQGSGHNVRLHAGVHGGNQDQHHRIVVSAPRAQEHVVAVGGGGGNAECECQCDKHGHGGSIVVEHLDRLHEHAHAVVEGIHSGHENIRIVGRGHGGKDPHVVKFYAREGKGSNVVRLRSLDTVHGVHGKAHFDGHVAPTSSSRQADFQHLLDAMKTLENELRELRSMVEELNASERGKRHPQHF